MTKTDEMDWLCFLLRHTLIICRAFVVHTYYVGTIQRLARAAYRAAPCTTCLRRNARAFLREHVVHGYGAAP